MAKKGSLKRKAPSAVNSMSETSSVSVVHDETELVCDVMKPHEPIIIEATADQGMIQDDPPATEGHIPCSSNTDSVIQDQSGPADAMTCTDETPSPDQGELEEKWDLAHILTDEEINSTDAQRCMSKRCPLLACCKYVSSLDPSNVWFCCVDCQEKDYGGWPESPELPVPIMTLEHRATIVEKCSGRYAPDMPNIPPSLDPPPSEDRIHSTPSVLDPNDATESDAKVEPLASEQDSSMTVAKINTISPIPMSVPMTADENEPAGPSDAMTNDNADGTLSPDEEAEEKWDLTHILTIDEINSSNAQRCMTRRCPLLACCKYVSSLDPSNVWFCCVDCQEKDYGGWPESPELPVPIMTPAHRATIAEKCSGRYAPDMPNIPMSLDATNPISTVHHLSDKTSVVDEHPSASHPHAITPPPNKVSKSLDKKPAQMDESLTKKKSTVTPSPAFMAIHQKWLETAKALGGEKLIVCKNAAKKVIFDLLHDAFRPMNITDIFNALKGVVPSPVLKSSLDEMSPINTKEQFFDDSDDENDDKKTTKSKVNSASTVSKSTDAYTATICVKEGRNASVTIYYVDQNKLFNNGDGMTPDSRNTLITKHESAKAELENLNEILNQTIAQTSVLLSQPTNAEADAKLEEVENAVQKLTEELDVSQSYKGNEKRRKQIIKGIETMTAVWRARKRLTTDFLTMMEEITEGSVSIKKSLSGDGPLELDSDEAVLKAAKTFSSKKRALVDTNRVHSMKKVKLSAGDIVSSGQDAFIGVMLDSRGMVKRVFAQD